MLVTGDRNGRAIFKLSETCSQSSVNYGSRYVEKMRKSPPEYPDVYQWFMEDTSRKQTKKVALSGAETNGHCKLQNPLFPCS